jgi:hypothetical protein
MGHIGVKGLKSAVDGITFDDSRDHNHSSCPTCAKANIKRSPFPHVASHRATTLLERIHCDICGPLPPCYGSYQYFILFIDCYSRFIFVSFMKSRDDASRLFTEFRAIAQNFSDHTIKILRVDNAPELVRGNLESICKTDGITYEKTVPYSPNQNGVAERCNQTLASMARAMLLDADLTTWFWPFAIQTAVHIKNRVPHSNLPTNTTPFHLWYHRKPDLSHFRLFGSYCTSRILSPSTSKFDPRGESARFLGYARDAKGYTLWVPNPDGHGGSVKIRRDVLFHGFPQPSEQQGDFPLWDDLQHPENPAVYELRVFTSHYHLFIGIFSLSDRALIPAEPHKDAISGTSVVDPDCAHYPRTPFPHDVPNTAPSGSNSLASVGVPFAVDTHALPHSSESASVDLPESELNPMWVLTVPFIPNAFLKKTLLPRSSSGRPIRTIRPPKRYEDYVDSDTIVQQLTQLDDEELQIPLDENTPFLSAIHTIASADALILSLHDDDISDPETVSEARRSKYWTEWLAAIHEELESLKAKGVYEELHTIPPGRKAVQYKWVLHIKRDKDGVISRFKARLVAKGFTQIPGQDFSFTFAPVARWDTIRSILCVTALNDYELRQLDVKTAYLNGPLDEEIYMNAPEGFTSSSPYWRLRKGLYGLRQAGRQWYLTLHQAYSDLGYVRCESDWSAYSRHTPNGFSMSATSVDDILLASDSKTESDRAANEINNKFTTTDGGDAEWILGCRITRCRPKRLLMIDQAQFASTILREFGMERCNSVKTPSPKSRLTSEMCPQTDAEREEVALLPYRAIVGKCMYLSTCTRPDISFAVRELARFMSNYGRQHYDAAKQLLRYIKGTISRGIIYGDSDNSTPIFHSFTDSDWAMSEGRKSISGYVVLCGGGPITWSSKQQTIVALSSCEAEYIACTHCAREIIWLRSLFDELGFSQAFPTILYCDNQGTVSCSHDPHSHSRMKHIDIRAHFIRDCVNRRLVDVQHLPGIQNPSDLFTKPLDRVLHQKWIHCLRLDVNQDKIVTVA